METLKAQLKQENDLNVERLKMQATIDLEKFKSQLQVAAAERNVRFSRVFEESLATIAATYGKLVEFQALLLKYIHPFQTPGSPEHKTVGQNVIEKHNEFVNYYTPRRIFLPKSTVKHVESFYIKLKAIHHSFALGVLNVHEAGGRPDTVKWIQVSEVVESDLPPLLNELEDAFRRTLGNQEGEET